MVAGLLLFLSYFDVARFAAMHVRRHLLCLQNESYFWQVTWYNLLHRCKPWKFATNVSHVIV